MERVLRECDFESLATMVTHDEIDAGVSLLGYGGR